MLSIHCTDKLVLIHIETKIYRIWNRLFITLFHIKMS